MAGKLKMWAKDWDHLRTGDRVIARAKDQSWEIRGKVLMQDQEVLVRVRGNYIPISKDEFYFAEREEEA